MSNIISLTPRAAYFISEWDKCAGITVDGSGDFVSCLLAECDGDEIRPLKKIFVPHSLGTLYTAVCQFIGYPKYGDEGKVMGLAPLGTDVYHDFFEGILSPTENGFSLNPEYFLPFGANQGMEINDEGEMIVHRLFSDKFVNELGPPREKYAEITQRDQDVAFGLQRVFEKYYMHLLNSLHKLVPTERISMAGGCALNSVANGKALIETPFRETCIQPAAGDDGLAIGAALYVSNSILKEGKRWVMKDAYLGNEFSDTVIKAELERYKIDHREAGPRGSAGRDGGRDQERECRRMVPGQDGMGAAGIGKPLDPRPSGFPEHERHPECPHKTPRALQAFCSFGFGRKAVRAFRTGSSFAIYAACLQDQASMARATIRRKSR